MPQRNKFGSLVRINRLFCVENPSSLITHVKNTTLFMHMYIFNIHTSIKFIKD